MIQLEDYYLKKIVERHGYQALDALYFCQTLCWTVASRLREYVYDGLYRGCNTREEITEKYETNLEFLKTESFLKLPIQLQESMIFRHEDNTRILNLLDWFETRFEEEYKFDPDDPEWITQLNQVINLAFN